MKAIDYLYDQDTGEYQHPEFAQESPLEPGVYLHLNFSTPIPPPSCLPDEVAVFLDGSWKKRPKSEYPPKIEINEKNYYSGEDSNNKFVVIQYPFHKIPSPPRIPRLLNGALLSINVAKRLEYIQKQVNIAVNLYLHKNVDEYFFAIESVLHSMKRVADDLTMSCYCMLYKDEVLKNKAILVDGIGYIFHTEDKSKFAREIIDNFIAQHDEFPLILSEIVNSYKHSYLLHEARTIWGIDFPTVVSIYSYRNKYSGAITYHNHSLGQLLIGFNNLVKTIINNQQTYLDSQSKQP